MSRREVTTPSPEGDMSTLILPVQADYGQHIYHIYLYSSSIPYNSPVQGITPPPPLYSGNLPHFCRKSAVNILTLLDVILEC